jgi:hypothetical protein
VDETIEKGIFHMVWAAGLDGEWATGQLAGSRTLLADPREFQQKFNVKPFMFNHDLANSSLFSLPRLAAVAERMLARGDDKNVVTRGGKSNFSDAKFSAMPLKERLAETVRRIADENVWLKLTSVDTADPEYDELRQRVLREVEELSGRPLLGNITWSSLTVFVASPRVTTPYHIDHESNFLLQIRGAKDISLYDPNDREIVPDDQLERFYSGDFEAAQYRSELQSRAHVFRLVPGKVVHHPPLAPHWVQNGDDVSVSLSIGFCLRPLDRRARVHQVNHFLRRFGMQPTPPGRSALRDGLKMAAIGMLSKSNPTTPQDILFSGLTRLLAVPRAVKRGLGLLRRS